MALRKPKSLNPTMKIKAEGENDIPFEEIQASVMDIYDVNTVHGDKVICVLQDKDMREFNVFLNNSSIKNFCDKYGENDSVWKGKIVDIKKEKDNKFKTDMIVLYPL